MRWRLSVNTFCKALIVIFLPINAALAVFACSESISTNRDAHRITDQRYFLRAPF